MKRGMIGILTAILGLGLAGGGWAEKTPKAPYVVGAVCSISGPNAPLGTPERDTLLMLTEKLNQKGGVNGHPLKVMIEDDGSDNTNAVKAAKKLVEQDRVCALIGSSGTGPTMAMIPVAEANEVPQVSMAAGSAITIPLKKWVFRTAQTDNLAIRAILADLAGKRRINKVALLYDSNAYGSNGRDQLRGLVPQYKVTVVAEEAFATKDTDMVVQLTKIRATDAQAIICWGTNPAPAQVAKNRQQLGLDLPLLMSHGVANQAFLDQAGQAADGVMLPAGKLIAAAALPRSDPQRKLLLEYAGDFQAKYNRPADSFGGYAWDALNIIVQALKRAGDNRAKLREAIEQTRRLPGVSGMFTYAPDNHDGLGGDAFVMVRVSKGRWQLAKK